MKTQAELHKLASAEVPIADYVPMGVHIAPNIIKLKSGGDYIAIWKLDGISFETVEFEELNARKEALNNFLRTLSGGHFALWTHKVRRLVQERLNSTFSNSFCADLDQAYQKTFDTYRMMATELYLTVIYRSHSSKVSNFFKRATTRTVEQLAHIEQTSLDVLDDYANQVHSSLAKYGVKRLSTFKKNNVVL